MASFFYYSRPTGKMTSCALIPFSQQRANSAHTHTHGHEASSCLVKKLLKTKKQKTKGETVQSHDFTGHAQAALLPIFSAVELFHAIMPDLTDEGVKSILNSLKNIRKADKGYFINTYAVCEDLC